MARAVVPLMRKFREASDTVSAAWAMVADGADTAAATEETAAGAIPDNGAVVMAATAPDLAEDKA